MKKILVLVFAIFIGLSFAQESVVISPQSIVVNPKAAPSFTVDVWVDKDPSGNATPRYAIGENISISVRVSEQAYIYLFDIRSNGEIDQILPNNFDTQGKSNLLAAGQVKTFPHPDAPYTFKVDGPAGLDKLFVVASKDPLAVTTLASFNNDPNFASSDLGQQGFAQTLSIIVAPKPASSWVTDAIGFIVGNPPSVPTYGTLRIQSNPSGAAAYVDGQYVGNTPVRYGTTSGSHTISVRQSGYQDFSSSVNVPGGGTIPVVANLSRIVQNGRLNLSSTPSGAQVYIDGQIAGNSPLAVNIAAGRHTVEFKRSGYETATATVDVRAGGTATYNAILAQIRREGKVSFDSNPRGVQVTVDGQVVGSTPTAEMLLGSGVHQVVFSRAGYESKTLNFTVTDNSRQTVSTSLTMVPQFGNFMIISNITNALVFIDGQQQGTIPAGNRLTVGNIPTGNHEIVVIAPGYRTFIQEVNVVAGQTLTINGNLTSR